MKDWLRDKLLPAIIMGLVAGAVQTYVQVQMLRVQVDRLEVYVQQLWDAKH